MTWACTPGCRHDHVSTNIYDVKIIYEKMNIETDICNTFKKTKIAT